MTFCKVCHVEIFSVPALNLKASGCFLQKHVAFSLFRNNFENFWRQVANNSVKALFTHHLPDFVLCVCHHTLAYQNRNGTMPKKIGLTFTLQLTVASQWIL